MHCAVHSPPVLLLMVGKRMRWMGLFFCFFLKEVIVWKIVPHLLPVTTVQNSKEKAWKVQNLWETYIIHVFFSFFFTARNLYVTSTIVMDRYALVPALLSRDQADSLLLFAFPFPLFLNMLSMVQRKCLFINILWVVEFKIG